MPVGEVLQSTTPILLCTTTRYSSTTPYCKVLLQYYPVLQSTTPVTLFSQSTTTYYSSTTKYYSSTTLYYNVLLQYYLCTTKYNSSTTLSYKVALIIDPPHIWNVISMRRTTSVILQLHQILRLPWKMSLRIDPAHIRNVIYHARSNKRQPPPSQNTAPARQNESHDWSASHVKRDLQCAVQQESASNFTKYCACHAKWISWSIRLTHETSFTIRRASKVILPTHQVLHLPRKMNLIIDPPHIWNVIYNARNNKRHPPTSPNTASATKNESQDWSCLHLKRHLPCVEQQHSPSNLTKYCACHAKWHSKIGRKSTE